jgi:hypothetical protein
MSVMRTSGGLTIALVLAACGPRGTAAPKPVGNESEAPPAREWRPTAEQRARLEAVIAEARAAHDAEDAEGCAEKLGEVVPEWLGSELDAGLLELAMACAGRSDGYCDYYLEDDVYCALKLETELAPRRAFADAARARCGFGNHELSVALPGEADRCVAVEPGAGAELEELDDEGVAPEGACPRLVVLERDGAGARTVEIAREGQSFLDSVSDCCHASELAARRDGESLRIVLSSGGPSRDCFGGTASVDEFEVFRLDGDRLVLETQHSVLMH